MKDIIADEPKTEQSASSAVDAIVMQPDLTKEEAYKNIKLDVASYGYVTIRCFLWAKDSGLDGCQFAKAVSNGRWLYTGKTYPRSVNYFK